MRIAARVFGGWCLIAVIAVAGLAAASNDSRNALQLADAVKAGDQAAVRQLLEQHANVNAPQADGSTALFSAVHRDDLATTDLLLRAGAKVNITNGYGVTPLWLACRNGNAAIIEKLLSAGADANASFSTGETALMTASNSGNAEAVKVLLSHGAKVNAKEPNLGQTALMWAAAEKHPEVVKMLIEHGADIHARSKGGFTPLLFAAQAGDLDSARILIDAGEDVNETAPSHGQLAAWGRPDGMSPLVLAAAMGHEALGIFLLEKGANANATDLNGITPLHYAVRKGLSILGDVQYNPYANYLFRPSMLDLMKALLAHGANPNAQLTKQLPEPPFTRGSRLTTIGMTPFMLAAAAGDVPAMRVLLAGGADPNIRNAEMVTPLMVSAGMGRFVDFLEGEEQLCLEAIKLELELGADVNAATGRGQTALHAAAHSGVNTILQYLVDHGANLNAKDILGQTPWNMAMGILSEGSLRFEKLDAPHPAAAALLVKLGATPVLAKDLPPPPESAKEAFYFRRQKGVSGDDEESKSPSAQQ